MTAVDVDAILREIARCDREIHAAETQPPGARAYLTVMGIEDWRYEKMLLVGMLIEESAESYEASEALLRLREGA